MGAGHFGHPQDTSAPSLSRITGGAVCRRNCPRCPKCPDFSSIRCRSVSWPKCPVTFGIRGRAMTHGAKIGTLNGLSPVSGTYVMQICMVLGMRHRFSPGSRLRTRPLLRPIGSIPYWTRPSFGKVLETPLMIKVVHGDDGKSSPLAAISQPKIHVNALAYGAPTRTPLGEFTALP